MRRGRLTSGLVALLTLAAVGALLLARGGRMFSPGGLSAFARRGVALGGVPSHAELGGNCSACHVAPWGRETMAGRCLGCHEDVRAQIEEKKPLHGRMSEGMACRRCHTEHHGPHAALTSLASFDHDLTGFALTGKHRGVGCASCHPRNVFKGTPQACASCHAEPAVHKGRYGTDCARCHSAASWGGATFKHTFPLSHGARRRRTNACATCHPKAHDYRTYTCYGCHAHEPGRIERKHVRRGITDFEGCVRCHPTGREHERRGR
jgi:hypothetical protein